MTFVEGPRPLQPQCGEQHPHHSCSPCCAVRKPCRSDLALPMILRGDVANPQTSLCQAPAELLTQRCLVVAHLHI